MNQIRFHIAGLLVVVLVFTGHSMAIARGMPSAAGSITLCTGTGPVMVSVDANGEPIGPSHICPDCSLMLMDRPDLSDIRLVPVSRFSEKLSWPRVVWGQSSLSRDTRARGPPVLLISKLL